jgi:hypothetical protein
MPACLIVSHFFEKGLPQRGSAISVPTLISHFYANISRLEEKNIFFMDINH